MTSTTHDHSVWSNIRSKLRSGFGKNIDNAWFSTLIPVENESSKSLLLKAPSPFSRDWIKTHYGEAIEKYSNDMGYRFDMFSSIVVG